MQAKAKLLLTGISICLLCTAASFDSARAQGLPSNEIIQGEVQKSLSQLATYTSAGGFKLKVPRNWEGGDPKQGSIVCKFRALNGLVSARVAVENLPQGMTLETYSKATNDQVKAFMASKNMPVTDISETATQLGASPAQQSVYSYQLAGTPYTARALQIMTIKNGRGYGFNFTAADGTLYDAFIKVVSVMINSFEWL